MNIQIVSRNANTTRTTQHLFIDLNKREKLGLYENLIFIFSLVTLKWYLILDFKIN